MPIRSVAIAASAALIVGVSADLAAADLSGEDLVESMAAAKAELPITDAFAIAAKEVGGGALVDYEVDVEDGMLSYLIEIRNSSGLHEVEVNGRTGDVIDIDAE
jgi:uncharacterized membrane protein YkoI